MDGPAACAKWIPRLLCRASRRFSSPKKPVFQDEAHRRRIGLLYRFSNCSISEHPQIRAHDVRRQEGTGHRHSARTNQPWRKSSPFGLFHHPELAAFWVYQALPQRTAVQDEKQRVLPRTWILDPRPVPRRRSFRTWQSADARCRTFVALAQTTQKERRLVIKPSGFSELAWGSRASPSGTICRKSNGPPPWNRHSSRFQRHPCYRNFTKVVCSIQPTSMNDAIPWCRCPGGTLVALLFYCRRQGRAGGVGHAVPSNKKIIHGMVDAIMAPCAINPDMVAEGEGANGGRHTCSCPMTDQHCHRRNSWL